MTLVDVRRLAAIDLHGAAGTGLRRRLILAEFVVGADVGSELRRYSYLQAWIFVPLLMAVLAISQARGALRARG